MSDDLPGLCGEWFDAWPNGEYGTVRCQRRSSHQGHHWHQIAAGSNPDDNPTESDESGSSESAAKDTDNNGTD